MFTVEGFTPDGIAYGVQVGGPDEPVAGSPHALAILDAHVGEQVLATPTGPLVTVALDDETAVLGALTALTTVVAVTGEPPELHQPEQPGVVY